MDRYMSFYHYICKMINTKTSNYTHMTIYRTLNYDNDNETSLCLNNKTNKF